MNLAWLAAVLTPNEIGPAINFDPTADDRPEADIAALITGRRPSWQRVSADEPKATDLSLNLVEDAIYARSWAAREPLNEYLLGERMADDPAKMAALTLTACALSAGYEHYEACMDLLETGLSRINEQNSQSNLIRAVLLQQRALRRMDAGQIFLEDVNRCLEFLDAVDPTDCDDFSLRGSSNADPVEVAKRIKSIISQAAWSIVPEDIMLDELRHGTSPRQSHERNFGRSDAYREIDSEIAIELGRWLDDLYDSALKHSNTRTWGRRQPDLYFQNLQLEIKGHREVHSTRKKLAMMRIVQSLPTLDGTDVAGCLHLLRDSRSESELSLLVNQILMGGPLDALATDARQILQHRMLVADLRSVEMLVLEAAADLLSRDEATYALDKVLATVDSGGPYAPPGTWRALSERYKAGWKAAAALGRLAGASSKVADHLFSHLTEERLDDIQWDLTFATAIRAIDWSSVGQLARKNWQRISEQSNVSRGPYTVEALRSAFGLASDTPAAEGEVITPGIAADRINAYLRANEVMPRSEAAELFAVASGAMSNIAADAASGRFATGVIVPAEIASHLLAHLPPDDLDSWRILLDFLTNSRVARADRTLGFDVLTTSRTPMPLPLIDEYRIRIRNTIEQDDVQFVAPDVTITPYPAALRFGFAYKTITDDEAFTYAARLLSQQVPQATEEAAATITSFSNTSEASWVQMLAVQVSHNLDPRVRARVIGALVRTADQTTEKPSVAISRLVELLSEDGIAVPLNSLREMSRMKTLPDGLLTRIGVLRAQHPSRRIRDQAAKVLATHMPW